MSCQLVCRYIEKGIGVFGICRIEIGIVKTHMALSVVLGFRNEIGTKKIIDDLLNGFGLLGSLFSAFQRWGE